MSTGTAIGVGAADSTAGIGAARTSTKGVQQTAVSKLLERPKPSEVPMDFDTATKIATPLGLASLLPFLFGYWIIGLIMLIIAGSMLIQARPTAEVEEIKRRNIAEQLRWDSEYFCHTCGNRFLP